MIVQPLRPQYAHPPCFYIQTCYITTHSLYRGGHKSTTGDGHKKLGSVPSPHSLVGAYNLHPPSRRSMCHIFIFLHYDLPCNDDTCSVTGWEHKRGTQIQELDEKERGEGMGRFEAKHPNSRRRC